MMAYRVVTRPLLRSTKPVRSPQYLAWIRKQPSVVSHLWPVEACHTGIHGLKQKASDLDCIPLTKREHAAFDKDPQAFVALHGLDIGKLIVEFNQRYVREVLGSEVPEKKPVGRENG